MAVKQATLILLVGLTLALSVAPTTSADPTNSCGNNLSVTAGHGHLQRVTPNGAGGGVLAQLAYDVEGLIGCASKTEDVNACLLSKVIEDRAEAVAHLVKCDNLNGP